MDAAWYSPDRVTDQNQNRASTNWMIAGEEDTDSRRLSGQIQGDDSLTDLRIVNWNTKWMRSLGKRENYIRELMGNGPSVMVMQEVEPGGIRELRKHIAGDAEVVHSMDHYSCETSGRRARSLGIAMIASNGAHIESAHVIDDALLPERTLVADVTSGGQGFRIMGLHSVPGCTYHMKKSDQFDIFTDAVRELHPDAVCMDANEPRFDGPSVDDMEFFVQSGRTEKKDGRGAERFFRSLVEDGLGDSLMRHYDGVWESEKCLAHSYTINGRKRREVRYDFVFLRKSRFSEWSCRYDYQGARDAGSDHASVIVKTVTD